MRLVGEKERIILYKMYFKNLEKPKRERTKRTISTNGEVRLLQIGPFREENKAFFIKVWKSPPSRCVLKTLRKSPKEKAQRGQYTDYETRAKHTSMGKNSSKTQAYYRTKLHKPSSQE